ncbi:MurR/RpiR family transcriptional regulator [Terrisporobacter glycolicus]|nr:MurR/RpiR family transcriptional regulator [Terrisporobacter glycolicus]
MKIDELVNKYYDRLSQNDLHIWQYINSNKEECCNLSIHELAVRCNVSKTTILRFAKKLSLKGYSELKVYLSWEKNFINEENLDDLFIDNICEGWKSSIDDIKEKDFTQINEMIYKSKRVFLYGTGTLQVGVAKELKRMFLYCGEIFNIVEGRNETEVILNNITPDDLFILISLTGNSEGAIKLAKQLLVKNIPFVSITKLKNNELARMSTKSIYIATSIVEFGNGIFHEASNLFFILAEVLFLRYASYKKKMDVSTLKL